MKIGLPYMRGPHMMIYKAEFASGDSSVISTRDLESIQHYMQYSQNHKNLMETGWKRQKRKRLEIPKWLGYDVYQLLWRSNRVWRLSSHSGRCRCLNKIGEKRYYQFTIFYWKVAKRYCSTSFHSSFHHKMFHPSLRNQTKALQVSLSPYTLLSCLLISST